MFHLIESSASLSTEQTCQLITASLWTCRLLQVARSRLFVSGSVLVVSEDLLTLLTLHIIWLKKHLFPHLTRLLDRYFERVGHFLFKC